MGREDSAGRWEGVKWRWYGICGVAWLGMACGSGCNLRRHVRHVMRHGMPCHDHATPCSAMHMQSTCHATDARPVPFHHDGRTTHASCSHQSKWFPGAGQQPSSWRPLPPPPKSTCSRTCRENDWHGKEGGIQQVDQLHQLDQQPGCVCAHCAAAASLIASSELTCTGASQASSGA